MKYFSADILNGWVLPGSSLHKAPGGCAFRIQQFHKVVYTHTQTTVLLPFPGPPGWAGARRELLDFVAQEKINRGRHIDHPAGRHSIRTNQCWPPPSPQGSVATHLRFSGIFSYFVIRNLLLSLSMKEFWKLVSIWQTWRQKQSGSISSRYRV